MPALTLYELGDNGPDLPSVSPFCLKAHLALGALGLPYQRAHSNNPAAWKDKNSTGQVPIMGFDDEVVPDSTAIIRRLMLLAPGRLNVGFTAADNAEAFLWEELADGELSGFLTAARWLDDDNWIRVKAAYFGGMPPPVRAVVPTLLRRGIRKNLVAREHWRRGPVACWQRFHRLLDALEARTPVDGFWLGALSTADIALAAQLRSFMTPMTSAQGDAVRRRLRLHAYVDRVLVACGLPTTGTASVAPTATTAKAVHRTG